MRPPCSIDLNHVPESYKTNQLSKSHKLSEILLQNLVDFSLSFLIDLPSRANALIWVQKYIVKIAHMLRENTYITLASKVGLI